MPVIKSETIEGRTYILSEFGDVWRVEIAYDGQAEMQLLVAITKKKANELMKPVFAQFVSK